MKYWRNWWHISCVTILAKDVGSPEIPSNILFNGVPVSGNKIADCFADFFDEKVKNLVKNVGVDELVENGTQS